MTPVCLMGDRPLQERLEVDVRSPPRDEAEGARSRALLIKGKAHNQVLSVRPSHHAHTRARQAGRRVAVGSCFVVSVAGAEGD